MRAGGDNSKTYWS